MLYFFGKGELLFPFTHQQFNPKGMSITMKNWGFFWRLLIILACNFNHDPYAVEISLSQRLAFREWYSSEPKSHLQMKIDGAEEIQDADIVVAVSPFTVLQVESLHPNFSVSYTFDHGLATFQLRRIANESWNRTEIADIALNISAAGKYKNGEFPIYEAHMKGIDGSWIREITAIPGSWYGGSYDIVVYYVPIRVYRGKEKSPVPNALIIFESIGRADLVNWYITDKNGIAQTPVDLQYSGLPEKYRKYLPDLLFSNQYMQGFFVRAIVVSLDEINLAFSPFITIIEPYQDQNRDGQLDDIEIWIDREFSAVNYWQELDSIQ